MKLVCKDCKCEFDRPSSRGPAPKRCLHCRNKALLRAKDRWRKRNPEYMKQVQKDRAMLRRLDRVVPDCIDCGIQIEWTKDYRAKRCISCMRKYDNARRKKAYDRRKFSRTQNRSSQNASSQNECIQVRETRRARDHSSTS